MKKVGIQPKDIEVEVDDKNDPEFNVEAAKPKNTGGRPLKNFDDLTRKTQLKRLRPIYEQAKITAKKSKISVKKALAKVAEHDANIEGNADDSRMFKAIVAEENPLKFKRMEVEKAVALQVHAGLSRTPWNVVRDGFSDSTSVPCRYMIYCSVTNSLI